MNWIKCSERLPEKFEDVFVICKVRDITFVFVAYIDKYNDWNSVVSHVRCDCRYIEDRFENKDIIFWKPIELPEEIEK